MVNNVSVTLCTRCIMCWSWLMVHCIHSPTPNIYLALRGWKSLPYTLRMQTQTWQFRMAWSLLKQSVASGPFKGVILSEAACHPVCSFPGPLILISGKSLDVSLSMPPMCYDRHIMHLLLRPTHEAPCIKTDWHNMHHVQRERPTRYALQLRLTQQAPLT